MDMISEKDLEAAKKLEPSVRETAKIPELEPGEVERMLKELENPVNAQKELALQIKRFLDHRIKFELERDGVLSDHTRRWVGSYDKILEKIQRALHGDKSVNFHLHRVSHSDIAAKMRKHVKNE